VRKVAISILLTISLLSCENRIINDDSAAEFQQRESSVSSFVVPQEKAIADLQEVLSAIDKNALGLRAGRQREIRNIEVVTAERAKRNSGLRSALNPADTLVYVVNFANDAGYAVLAADARIPASVLVVTDNGTLAQDELTDSEIEPFDSAVDYGYEILNNFNLYNEEEDDYYVAAAESSPIDRIYQYALLMTEDYGNLSGNGSGSGSNTRQDTLEWIVNNSVPAKLETAWTQRSPFNDDVPKTSWCPIFCSAKRCPVGCVAVALAQIMAYHEYPSSFKSNGDNIWWDDVKEIYNVNDRSLRTGSPAQNKRAAEVLFHVAKYSRTIFTPDWGFAMPKDAAAFLEIEARYSGIGMYGYSESKILDMLDRDNPVFIASISGWVSGHAWVIDGYINRSRTINTVSRSTGSVQSSRNENELLVHCNWGWQGKC